MLTKLSVEDSVAVLTLNNPGKMNALSSDLIREIGEKISNIEQKANVLIITGEGRAFAAGVNVAEIDRHSCESALKEDFIDYQWESVARVKIPTIAAVSGYALGGGFELALMCDIIVATENSKFGFPEVNLGIMPGMGGTQMLTRIVGSKLASRIIMTGNFLSATEAKELGIVSEVVSNDGLISGVTELARSIAEKPALSLRLIKEAINLAQNVGLTQGMRSERLMFRSLFSTRDKNEKVKEFLKSSA
jgi:enoyl-CoA hydratase/carnithine racemase